MRLIGVLVLASLCLSHWSSAYAGTPAAADAEDQKVVAIAVEDLATNRGPGSPIDGIFSPDPLTLDPRPARYPLTHDEVLLLQSPSKRWQELSATEALAAGEAADDLAARVKGPEVRFTAGSRNVPLYAGDPEKAPRRETPIWVWLPGYSKNRETAVITLGITWSIHGCRGTFVLGRSAGSWKVRAREFACYL
jgi:hypothetical protein